jgi:hypothetical protein
LFRRGCAGLNAALKQTEYGLLLLRDFTVVFAAIFELNN